MPLKIGVGFRALKVGGTDSRKLVFAGKGERGTIWEFLEVFGLAFLISSLFSKIRL